MTKQELSQLFYLNREIEQQKETLAEYQARVTNGTGRLSGMPKGAGRADPVARYGALMADLSQVMEENIQRCWQLLEQIHRYIGQIPDSLVRQIFLLRYAKGMSWQQVAMAVGGGNTADGVRMLHDRYLKSGERMQTGLKGGS